MNEKLKQLTELFRAAGAMAPQGWAESEIREDIPQLARYLFLRAAWRTLIEDGDVNWIARARQPARDPQAPLAGLSPAVNRLLATGVDPKDLTDVVRIMQYEVLFGICHLLDDPSMALDGIADPPRALEDVGWALLEADSDEGLGRRINGLHESVLETDPTGREMRPRAAR